MLRSASSLPHGTSCTPEPWGILAECPQALSFSGSEEGVVGVWAAMMRHAEFPSLGPELTGIRERERGGGGYVCTSPAMSLLLTHSRSLPHNLGGVLVAAGGTVGPPPPTGRL